jgi:hypothetical protein
MEPVSPVLTPELVPDEIVYGANQTQYIPLPVLRNNKGVVMSRWKLSDNEREAVAAGADILLSVHTYNGPLQPVRIEIVECDRDLVSIVEQMDLL